MAGSPSTGCAMMAAGDGRRSRCTAAGPEQQQPYHRRQGWRWWWREGGARGRDGGGGTSVERGKKGEVGGGVDKRVRREAVVAVESWGDYSRLARQSRRASPTAAAGQRSSVPRGGCTARRLRQGGEGVTTASGSCACRQHGGSTGGWQAAALTTRSRTGRGWHGGRQPATKGETARPTARGGTGRWSWVEARRRARRRPCRRRAGSQAWQPGGWGWRLSVTARVGPP